MLAKRSSSSRRKEGALRRHFVAVTVELQGFVKAGRGLQGQLSAFNAILRTSCGAEYQLEQIEPADKIDRTGGRIRRIDDLGLSRFTCGWRIDLESLLDRLAALSALAGQSPRFGLARQIESRLQKTAMTVRAGGDFQIEIGLGNTVGLNNR